MRLLRSGLLLEPHEAEEDGPRAVELGPDGIAVDGEPVTEEELEDLLGARAAELVSEAAALPAAELRALFAAQPAEEEAPSEEAEGIAEGIGEGIAAAIEREVVEGIEEGIRQEIEEEVGKETRRRVRRDTQVVVADSLTIEEDEISDDVVVVGGSLEVLGEVRGDAAVVGGSGTVSGEVTGDVAVIGGSVDLEEGSRVGGDVIAVGGSVERAEGAEIGGKIVETPFGPKIAFGPWLRHAADREIESAFERWMEFGWKVFRVVFVALLACLSLLVARRPIERMQGRIRSDPWRSGLAGLLGAVLFGPVLLLVVVVLCISIIGIPLLLVLPFALLGMVVAAFFGFVAVARLVGRGIAEKLGRAFDSPYLEVLAGIAGIYALSLVGKLLNIGPFPLRGIGVMLAIFGLLVWLAALTVGFGASLLTRFGSRESWQRAPVTPPPPPAPPAEAELPPAEPQLPAPAE